IVTFGAGGPAGACANTGGASIARMTKANTAVTSHLLITASSNVVSSNQLVAGNDNSTPTSPTTPTTVTPGDRHLGRRHSEGQPPARGHLLGIVGIAARVHPVQHFRASQCRACEQVRALEVERSVRGKPPRESRVRLGTDVAGVALYKAFIVHNRPADGTRGKARVGASVGIDLFSGPRRAHDAVHRERGRDAVRGPETEPGAAIAVVADEPGHIGQQRAVEVIDPRSQDRAPAGPVVPVHTDWLVVANALSEVVASLVARGVDAARFEQERTQLVATADVDDPGADVGLDAPDRAVRPHRLVVTVPPLVHERRIEAEGARAPAHVDPDRVAVLLVGRVARGGTAAERRRRVGAARTDEPTIDDGVSRGAGRQAIDVEIRVQRLDVESLERRDLRADGNRPVLAAARARRRVRPVTARELVLDDDVSEVDADVWVKLRNRRQSREIAVGVDDFVVGQGAPGLAAGPRDRLDRNERQQAVLPGQRKLGVDPLDLHHAGDVGVEEIKWIYTEFPLTGK